MKAWKAVWVALFLGVLVSVSALFSADWSYPFSDSSLGGVVKSAKGEPLEGILVRVRKEGATLAVTVISDANGKYRFPKLESGKYTVEIARADGLEPSKQDVVLGPGREGHADFTLGPPKDMALQMTIVDWLANLPGPAKQTEMVETYCTNCHLSAVMRFRFDKANWLKIIHFMREGGAGHGDTREPGLAAATAPRDQASREQENQVLAEYLEKVRGPQPLDLSQASILPRPTGRSTHAIFTEYDVPYANAEPHDTAVDPEGIVWWSDWRWGTLGRLDPATGERKYWELPQVKPNARPGTFRIVFDKDHNPWVALAWTGGLAKFDRKTEKFTTWVLPDRGARRTAQLGVDNVRGRIWFHTDDFNRKEAMGFYVPANKQYTLFDDVPAYGILTDSKGNGYALGWTYDNIVTRIDAETQERTVYPVPTPKSTPRRGDYDAQDRIWFAEYNADQIGMLDPKSGKITEYKLPAPAGKPYSVNVDRRTGLVWTAEFLKDRFAMLDPKTGEIREYLLPTRESRVRIIDSYSVGDHSVIWYGSLPVFEHASIVKLEVW